MYSCASSKHTLSELGGDYLEEGSFNTILSLSKDRYVFSKAFGQADVSPFICCDTMSTGTWQKTKDLKYLVLTSDFQTAYPLVTMEVIEEKSGHTDSLYFEVDNPIEQFQIGKTGKRYDHLFYRLEVSSNNPEFDTQTSLLKFNTNRFAMAKPQGLAMKSFSIIAVPKHDMKVRNLEIREAYTQEYSVDSKDTRRFKVSIPTLDYGLISQLRLRQDFVQIVNSKVLVWDGKFYQKK